MIHQTDPSGRRNNGASLIQFGVERLHGSPASKTVASPKPEAFAGMKGIIVVKGHGWSNAKGHVTLWDGTQCSDTCHLMSDPDNGTFAPETASLWVLK